MSIITALQNIKTVYFDDEGTLSTTLRLIGRGGSKKAFVVENIELPEIINNISIHDVVIVLPNLDDDKNYGYWISEKDSMPYLECTISDMLRERGLQTPHQQVFTIYLKIDDVFFSPSSMLCF
jgi:hypothetical protein